MNYSILRQIRISFLVLVAAVAGLPAAAQLDFYTVTPCRAYDSRGGGGLRNAGTTYTVPVVEPTVSCGVPADATAVALNVTVIGASGRGELVVFPAGATPPSTDGLPFPPGVTRARFSPVQLGTNDEISFLATFESGPGTYHVAIDVVGYFLNNTIANDDTATVDEDSAPTLIDVLANDSDPDDPLLIDSATDPANGTVVIAGDNLSLTYEPDGDYCNAPPGTTPDTFDYTLSTGSTATVEVTVNCVNDAPAGTDNAVSTAENTDYVFAVADFGFTDPLDTPANALLAVRITTLPALGSLTLSGGAVTAGQSIAVADITGGNLKFTPAVNGNGSPYTTFTFQVQDDGGTANGGVDLDPSANTLTINVTGVNNPPAGTDGAVSTPEDAQYTFAAADFGFTDPLDTPANNLASVIITTLPGLGTLTLSGSGFAAGTEIAVADITAGNLKYTPVAGASGSPYTTFTFQVRDDGGTAGGGVDLDASPNTLTVNVTAVNDAPAGTDNAVAVLEDVQYTFTAADFGFTDPNDTPANALASVVITTLPGAGTLTLSGGGFAAGTEISLANITGGNLKFTPAANGSGSPYTTFTFQVRDDGGTANGGVDLDASANTMTVNVAAVNDAPAGTDNTVAALEDAQYTFTAADFGFTDPNDSPANALASVVITTLPGVGSLTLSGGGFAAGTEISLANITAGNLKFTPAGNGSGSPYTTFTFQVRDDGGTANGGVDLDASANTMTVNVAAVNDAPAGTDNTVAALEDAQYTFTAADFGFTDPNDSPANALASVIITTLPGVGSLTLSGGGFAAGTEISLANITAGNLKFQGALNAFGSPYASFTFQVRDNGGTASGGVDLDPTPNTMTINVLPVNDAPTFGDATIDYSTVGNTQLRAGEAATGASVLHIADNLDVAEKSTPSDIDGPAPPFSYSLGTAPANGQATVNSDGTFTYEPNPGFAGPTDSFTVNVSDGGIPAGVAAVTVTVTISEMVWYVHDVTGANNPAAADDGRSTNAFEVLQDAINAAGQDDYVFVFRGNTGTTPHAPATLTNKDGLKLHGEGFGLSVPGFPGLVAAGSRAVVQNAAATGAEDNALQVTINAGTVDGVEIRGLEITATDNAIDVTVTGAAIAGVTISHNGIGTGTLEGIDVNHGSTSTTSTLAVHDNVLLTAGNAIDVTRTAGTLKITAFDDNVVSGDTTASGIVVTGPNISFDSIPGTAALDAVSGGNTSIGASGNPVASTGLALSQVSGSLSFTDLDIFAGGTSGSGLIVGGTGAFTGVAGTNVQVTPAAPDDIGTSTIDSDNGPAVDITSATIDLRLADLDSNTSTAGLSLNTVGGQLRAPSGSAISKTSGGGTAFSVASSSATVNYAGTLNVTSGSGVSLTSNSGATTFSGGMTLSTATNTAFTATGGGTVNVIDPAGLANNTITTTTATALNISGMTIGGSGVTFESINSTGAGANTAVILANTGAGQFMITGTAGAGTGGTISNKTVDAMTMDNTDGLVTLKNMILQDIGDLGGGLHTISGDDAIHAQQVDGGLTLEGMTIRRISDQAINGTLFAGGGATVWNGLTITNSTLEDTNRFNVANVGDANNEGMVRILGIRGTVDITGSTFQRGGELLDFFVTGGTLNMSATTNNFSFAYKEFTSGATASVGGHCVDVTVQGSGNANVTLGDRVNDALDNNFLNCRLGSVRVANDSGATGNIDVVIGKNDFTVNDHSSGIGGDFDFPQGGVLIMSRGTDTATFDVVIDGNYFDEITNASGGVGQVSYDMQNGIWQVLMQNNTFDTPGNAPWYLRADSSASAKVLFQNNVGIKGFFSCPDPSCAGGYDGPGLRALADVQNGGVIDLTILGDIFAEHDAGFDPGQTVEARVLNTGGGGTLCLDLQNNQAPDGYSLEEFAGDFNLVGSGTCPVGSPSANCQTLLGNRGNRGGSNVATTNPPFVNVEVGASIDVVAGACQQPTGGIF